MTTTEPPIVTVKMRGTTRDFLQRQKKPLGVPNIDGVVQRFIEMSKQACFLFDFNNMKDEGTVYAEYPCDPLYADEGKFNYGKCPSTCARYKNVKLTSWWFNICEVGTKEDYIKECLKDYREDKAGHESTMRMLVELYSTFKYKVRYSKPMTLEDDVSYIEAREAFEKPPPTRQLLESKWKRYVVEPTKECVLKMEKLRKQSLLVEWKKIWNYPACIEGIITVEEPEDVEALASPQE